MVYTERHCLVAIRAEDVALSRPQIYEDYFENMAHKTKKYSISVHKN